MHFKADASKWISLQSKVESDWSLCLQTLEGHSDWVHSVAFSPDGTAAGVGIRRPDRQALGCRDGRCLQTLEGHSDWVCSVAFSPDGKQLASASGDQTVRLWDAATGRCLQTLEGHSDSVYSVAFSPDGTAAGVGIRRPDRQALGRWDRALPADARGP